MGGFPSKIRNKAKMSTLAILLHKHTGSPSYCNKTRKGNKMYTDWEERHKTVFLHRWHNCHAENLKESIRKLLKPKVIITRWKDVS